MKEPSLAGRTILVTRAAEQAGELARQLEVLGARVLTVPLLEFTDPSSWEAADRSLAALSSYDAVAFTSVNAVERFFGRLGARPVTARIYAVGTKTADALKSRGVAVDGVPADFQAARLAELMQGVRRVLFPRAEAGREELAEALRAAGAQVDVAPVYRTVVPAGAGEALRAALAAGVDAVVFASPSAASHAVELAGTAPFEKPLIAAIGPVTAARCAELGLPAPLVPSRHTAADLAAAIGARLAARFG